ncbi:GIY-YIG nuclease family protein [Nioella sediminis]|uniref:GIY-YIG nuclease family protein n=1 Tax=Nioella sediminis TaxID=1912092 RepID=UPI001314405E|nr:GIY-YIG nuclease family protein [Nioella sediminis]
MDDALREPVQQVGQPGYIYLLTNDVTDLSYVGLSVNAPTIRWGQHRRDAAEGSKTPLHAAIREHGVEAFRLETIEVLEDGEDLGVRERHWIAELGTLVPDGYNVREGGQVGRTEGTPALWEGRSFPSIAAMCRELSRETGLAVHVIESRYREGLPLPEEARVHSDHPEAGSQLFRQWLGMKKRAAETAVGVAEAWLEYDAWKLDVAKLVGNGRLTRIDESRPWEPGNCVRLDHREIVRRTHGQAFSALGQTWATKQDALDAYGIARNTFDLRLRAGLSVDEALTRPLGPTSKAPITVDGECFESRNQACLALSARYGMTPDQVKDYLVREIPTAEWPKHGQHVRTGSGVPVAYEVDGVRYASEKAMCRAFGIPNGTFQKRRKNGMTVDAALKTPVLDARLVIFGYEWPSAKAACAAFGLPYSTYRARVGKHGMTPEEALKTATRRGYAGTDWTKARMLCVAHGCPEIDQQNALQV